MLPSRPGMLSSYSGRQKPRQTAAPELKSTHPSDLGAQAARLATGTTCGAIPLHSLLRSRSGVFLPALPRSACVSSPHPPACSAIPVWKRPLSCSRLARKTAPPPSPSTPLASSPRSRPAAAPATPVSSARTLSRFPAGSAECVLRTVAGTSRTDGRGAPLLLHAFPRTSAPSKDIRLAAHPRTPRKSARLLLPPRWRLPESLFPSNP